MEQNINKAAVAYFATALLGLVADTERFDAKFLDDDLGGANVRMEAGIESLFTDDQYIAASTGEGAAVWENAYGYLLDEVSDDEAVTAAVNRFSSWEGPEQGRYGTGTIQRAMLKAARRVLAEVTKAPALTARD